jgi:hypothetical protein
MRKIQIIRKLSLFLVAFIGSINLTFAVQAEKEQAE